MEQRKFGGGLLPLPKDIRDFKYHKVFGTGQPCPDTDFEVAKPLAIKDQGSTDFCSGFSGAAVSEDQEGVILSGEFFFSRIKKITGDWKEYGADLRSVCKAACAYGFLEDSLSPYKVGKTPRSFIANPDNWGTNFDAAAMVHKKKSYFSIEGPDFFTAFRNALWNNRDLKCSILTGLDWEEDWTDAKGGIVPKKTSMVTGPHAVKIFGQKMINGELYLKLQNSWGEEYGDHGIYYLPKEVINKKCTFGSFMFIDIDPAEVKKLYWNWLQYLINWLNRISNQLQQIINNKN